MAYRILYIEDLEANSLKMDIEEFGIEVVTYKPTNFEETFLEMTSDNYHAILLDFKLDEETDHNILFNAPSLAQNLRTTNIDNKKYKPIFLITNQLNISTYYKDFSSHDLFDFVKTKKEFRTDLEIMCNRIVSFIEAYKTIQKVGCSIDKAFNVNDHQSNYIDYRIKEKLESEIYNQNVNKIAFYIYHKIIRSFNFLIGEEVLAARLGIDIQSEDWGNLLKFFEDFKYKGVYAQSHNRWWWNDVEKWWIDNFEGINLRRLKAGERCEKIKGFTKLENLKTAQKIQHSKSDSFWTICLDKHLPLDPIDGLELMKKELLPWQENEYISMLSALESSEKTKFVNKVDFQKMIAYSKTL
jgi:hypothetical protein